MCTANLDPVGSGYDTFRKTFFLHYIWKCGLPYMQFLERRVALVVRARRQRSGLLRPGQNCMELGMVGKW